MREVKVERSGFVAGTILMDIIACKEVVVGKDGVLRLAMADGNPEVLFPVDHLGWSGICDTSLSQTNTPKYPLISTG